MCSFGNKTFGNFVNILIAIFSFGLWAGFSGYTESMDDSIEVVVPQDDYGLYAIDILDPSYVSLAVTESILQF